MSFRKGPCKFVNDIFLNSSAIEEDKIQNKWVPFIITQILQGDTNDGWISFFLPLCCARAFYKDTINK